MDLHSKQMTHAYSPARILQVLGIFLAGTFAQNSYAAPIVTTSADSGTLVNTSYAVPSSTASNAPSPYGAGGSTLMPIAGGYQMIFRPSSSFMASANNLSGGGQSVIAGLLSFDITFDTAVNLRVGIFETGIYSSSGANTRAGGPNSDDAASGMIITALDDPHIHETVGRNFHNTAILDPLPTGAGNTFPADTGGWTLSDETSGFSKGYHKYHVVLENDLIAEALANPDGSAGFAAVALKDLTFTFTFDGVGPLPLVSSAPEPATTGTLLIAAGALVARRRRVRTT